MPFPDTPEQAKLISSSRAHAGVLLQAFIDATDEQESVTTSCDRASLAVDTYCDDLLKSLVSANPPTGASETAWLRSRYLTLIVEFGSAIRDAIRDSETRHAAAQGIQFRVLEHERHLRVALEAAALSHSPVVEITKPSPAESPLAKQDSYLSRPGVSPETV